MIPIKATRLAVAAALTLSATLAQAEAPFSFGATPGKLPKDVVPVQYVAHLVPNLADHSFVGSETVEIEVLKATSVIMLNAANLDIDAASLSGKSLTERKLVADRKSTRLNSSHIQKSRMPSSA